MACLNQFGFGCALAERGIPRNYSLSDAQEDIADSRHQGGKQAAHYGAHNGWQ